MSLCPYTGPEAAHWTGGDGPCILAESQGKASQGGTGAGRLLPARHTTSYSSSEILVDNFPRKFLTNSTHCCLHFCDLTSHLNYTGAHKCAHLSTVIPPLLTSVSNSIRETS